MSQDKPSALYKFLYKIVGLVYRPFTVVGRENLPAESCVIVGNHSQLHGPLGMEFYAARPRFTWCNHEMMSFKEAPNYTFTDFWSKKPASVRWLFKIVSYLIAPLCVLLFNNAKTIPVYHDNRLLETFRQSVKRLEEGNDVVIFPECYTPHNNIVYDFQKGFAETALFYRRKTGRDLSFVPMYLCPARREIHYGKPVTFDSSKPPKEETEAVRVYLMDAITAMAVALPRHRVVPYPNKPKKEYPYNK